VRGPPRGSSAADTAADTRSSAASGHRTTAGRDCCTCDPKNSHAYFNLGVVLPAGGSITLKDERTLTQQQLYVEAVHCDPKNSKAYLNLGAVIPAQIR